MTPQTQPAAMRQPTQALLCDYCEWPMPLPEHCREQGVIFGLLKCGQCIEDAIAARTLEAQP